MSRVDIFMLNARQSARRVSQTPANYACAIERYRNPADVAVRIALVCGAIAAIVAAIFN